jgi:hypothetical protein
MKMITVQTKIAGKDAFIHCLENTENFILDSLQKFTKFNGGIDNLIGSSCCTANIHFVHHYKLAQVKDILNKMVMLQSEDIANDEPEDIFYYLQFSFENTPYSIIIYNEDVINDNAADYTKDYGTIRQYINEISNLSDCYIFAGAAYNDYYFFDIIAYNILPYLKAVDGSDLEYFESIESTFTAINSKADYMSVNKNSPTLDDSIYFYKLIMDNLFIDSVKKMKNQGYNVSWQLYTYEKVNRYLKQK